MKYIDKIERLHIEWTSYCNARCPQCARTDNASLPLEMISMDSFKEWFTPELIKNVQYMYSCGNYGDPIAHPHCADFVNWFVDNGCSNVSLHTNGGARDTDFWKQLGERKIRVVFGIDGLEDTNHIYRVGVNWNKLISNVKTFINAGGQAEWAFLIFQHNEHQVEQAKELGNKLGFFNVLIRKTGRFFNHRTVEEMATWPVRDEYVIEPPNNPEFRNQSMMFLPDLKQQYGNITEYFNTTEIKCDAMIGSKVSVNAEGLVLPCNFFNHNLYDGRFYEPGVLPEANELSTVNGKNQVREFLESYNLDSFNINLHSLEEIFTNPMWADLASSWSKTLADGRLFECAMTCGSKITKVWDQGGSTR